MKDPFLSWQRMGLTSQINFNGVVMEVNSPEAPTSVGAGAMEIVQELPPPEQRPVFLVDDYADRVPAEWKRSTAQRISVFVPVIADPPHHLWLDFNGNHSNSHDVAVVPMMQLINAIHGQNADGPGLGPELVQYRRICPIHGTEFGANLRCEKCGFDWPPQNYMAASAQNRWFWLDGFRTKEGVVRGFLLTHDRSRGVASQKLGKRMTFELRFVFYLSNEPKPERPVRYRGSEGLLLTKGSAVNFGTMRGSVRTRGGTAHVREIHVGAGTKIEQKIERDPNKISYWQDDPVATIVVNLVDADECMEIVKNGPIGASQDEGPLGGLEVGNPIGLTSRLRNLHPSDLDAIIVSFPEAAAYISGGTPATKANELVHWAQHAGRTQDLEEALSRNE